MSLGLIARSRLSSPSCHSSLVTGGIMSNRFVGKSVKRTEDPRLIQGLGHYVDDIKLADTLTVMFLRSMYAHARITSLDVSEAAHTPGVVAVYTGKDVAQQVGAVPCASAGA